MIIENKNMPKIRPFLDLGINIYLMAFMFLVFISCQKRDQEIWLEFHHFSEIKHNGDIYVRTKSGKESYVFRLNYDNGDICEYNLIKDDEIFILDGPYFCLNPDQDTVVSGEMDDGEYHYKRFYENGKFYKEVVYDEDEFGAIIDYDSIGNIVYYCRTYQDTCFYKVRYDSSGNYNGHNGHPFTVIREIDKKSKGSNKIYGYVYLVEEPGIDTSFIYLRYPELLAQDPLAKGKIKKTDSLEYYFEVQFSKAGTYDIPFLTERCKLGSSMLFTNTFEIFAETE
ncbi:MAG: hypothetical protein R3C61_10540 [Bacteroidia bacterium]